MPRMVRKQVYIQSDQNERLKLRARESDVTESELIRQGIDLVTRTERLRQDEALWRDALVFMDRRARMRVPASPRTWSREEIYEERLEELARRRAR